MGTIYTGCACKIINGGFTYLLHILYYTSADYVFNHKYNLYYCESKFASKIFQSALYELLTLKLRKRPL
jgi:hypothetical protein